jgi:predicted metal-binding protein
MPYKEIEYEDIVFDKKVQSFCVNSQFKCPYYAHSWACPPEAPYLEEKISKYSHFFLIYTKFNLAAYVASNQKKYPERSKQQIINRFYAKSLTRDDLEEEVQQFLKEFKRNSENSLILWDGHCRICEQKGYKNCAYEQNEECRFPQEIRFSMEAVGIHVTKTVQNLGLEIEWPPKKYYYRFALASF